MHPSSCRISSTNRMTTTPCDRKHVSSLLRLLTCCSNVTWAKEACSASWKAFLEKKHMLSVNQHGNGTKTLSGMYFQLKVELPLPSCLIGLYFAKGWKSWTYYYSFYSRLLIFFLSPRFFLKKTRIHPTPYELLSQGTPIAPHVASQCPRASESSRWYHSPPPKGSPAPGLAPLGSQSRRTSHWIGAAPASVGAGRRPWGMCDVTSKLDGWRFEYPKVKLL